MENLTTKLSAILNQFVGEEMTVKKMKVIKKQLTLLKKEQISIIKETRKFMKETLVQEIKKSKEYIKNNVIKRIRKSKVAVVQEVEAPAIDPIVE